jgi:RNA-directed DNA polymerase
MNISEDQKKSIRDTFKVMKSKEDLLALLNFSKTILYDEKTVAFELKQLTFYSNTNVNKNRYIQFSIPKKSGGERIISAPTKGLKVIQKCLNLIFQVVYESHIHKAAMGFVPSKSIVDNANIHAGSNYVYNIDLKDFFPSINQARVWGRLKVPPFELSGSNGRLEINNIISSLCCHEMEVERKDENNNWVTVSKNVLPQGAPTSPILTNIICQQLDFYLSAVAKRFGLKYSRYADDITFSSMHNVYQMESPFLKEIDRIVKDQDFHIKPSKTRLQKKGYRQEVTGLLVNDKVNVQKRYIKQLRLYLYYWEQYGYERASTYFLPKYRADKGHVKKGDANMTNVIAGKLDYLKMVKGIDNEAYLKLNQRFKKLIGASEPEIVATTFSKTKKQDSKIDLSKHRPIDTNLFLSSFKSSEGLKFLTHDYDRAGSAFNREDLLKICKQEFDELSSKYEYNIKTALYARIKQFAFGDPKQSWWFNRVSYKGNWQTQELVSWTKRNPNLHPIRNEKFANEFILPFKQSIEIKSPELESLIKSKLAENLGPLYGAFEIELVDLDKANFYTDVDSLQTGLSYLFKAIKQRFQNSKKIKIEFLRKSDSSGRKRIIRITHVGSQCDKPLEKLEIIKGDLEEAEKAFFKICDWSIVSNSPDSSTNKLNVLFDIRSSTRPCEKIEDALVEGFTHILTFYS